MSKNKHTEKKHKKQNRIEKQNEQKKKEFKKMFILPLIKTFVLWVTLIGIVHLFIQTLGPAFITFTRVTLKTFCNIFFISIITESMNTVTILNFPIKIVMECTAYNYYLFAIALCAFAKWNIKDKVINLIIFLLTILILNNFRFIILAMIGNTSPELFDMIHDYLWNIVFALTTLVVWLVLNEKSQKRYMIKNNIKPIKIEDK